MASSYVLRLALLQVVEILFASTTGLSEDSSCPGKGPVPADASPYRALSSDGQWTAVEDADYADYFALLQTQVTGLTVGSEATSKIHTLLEPDSHESARSSGSATQSRVAVFKSFLEKHGREYAPGSPEHNWREKLFMKRAMATVRHNAKPDRLWTAAINKLADRSDDELHELLGWSGRALPGAAVGSEAGPPSLLQIGSVSSVHSWGHASSSLPADWSWGQLNATKHVHNQGACGSCWAVSAASVLQAHAEIHTPQRARSLSVQELVSCVENKRHCGGNGACDGATAELAMEYAMRYGLASGTGPEAVAPGMASDAIACPRRASSAATAGPSLLELDISAPGVHAGTSPAMSDSRSLGMRAWERLPPNTYMPLMQALVQRGPAAVAVFASKWFTYSHGIFDGCGRDAVIDHAVALIGYGNDQKLGANYWLIQNSWGPEWGENGRIRLLRHHSDETDYCGVDKQPMEGTGCDGGPAEVKVCGMCGVLYDTVVPHF